MRARGRPASPLAAPAPAAGSTALDPGAPAFVVAAGTTVAVAAGFALTGVLVAVAPVVVSVASGCDVFVASGTGVLDGCEDDVSVAAGWAFTMIVPCMAVPWTLQM